MYPQKAFSRPADAAPIVTGEARVGTLPGARPQELFPSMYLRRGITTHPPHGKHIVVCDAGQCHMRVAAADSPLANAVITKASA